MCLCSYGFRCVLDLPGWYAGIDAWLKNLIGWDNCTGGDDCSVWDNCMVHNDGAHADYNIAANHGAMHIGSMSDGNIVSNDSLRLFIGGMQDSIVLYIDSVTKADCTNISAKNSTIPYAAILSHAYRSDQSCRLC